MDDGMTAYELLALWGVGFLLAGVVFLVFVEYFE